MSSENVVVRNPWTSQEDEFLQKAAGPRKEIVAAFQETFGMMRTPAAIIARIPAKKSRVEAATATKVKGARAPSRVTDRVEGDASTVIAVVNAISVAKEAITALRAACTNMTDVEVDKIVRLAVSGK